MALTRLVLLLCIFCYISASDAQVQGRGFVASQDPKNSGQYVVDPAAADTLKSGLTTVFFPIVYIFIFVVGLLANGMAVWVFLFRTNKKHPASIYMANLALADLLFIVWLPLKIDYHIKGNNWIFGEPLCKVLVSFFYGNMYCSVLFIACLSMQRYWLVAHPLSQLRKNNKVAAGVCVAIWGFIWLTTTPLYLYDHTVKLKEPNITTCHDVSILDPSNPFNSVKLPFFYFIFMATFVFLVPCVVIIVANVMLLRALGRNTEKSTASKKRHKAVVLIMIVLVTFVVCFIPSNIMLVVHYSLLKNGVISNGYSFYISTLCLASLNSCLDPFIYYFVSEEFRNEVKNTLLCKSNRAVRQMKASEASFSSMKYSKKSKSYVSESGTTQTSSC